MKKFACAMIAWLMLTAPVLAQWQVPEHAIPIGRGAGTGFNHVAPNTAGYFLGSAGASADPTFQGFVQSGTGAATRTWQDKARDTVSILDFGADPTGVANSSTAFSNAMATGKIVHVPKGTYLISGTCPTMTVASGIVGDGAFQTVINTNCTGHAITVNTGFSGVVFKDFSLVRTGGTAVAGQDGIHFNNLTEQAYIDNLRIYSHYHNLRLGITSYSLVNRILSSDARGDGINISNADGPGGLQWYLFDSLIQLSSGNGIGVYTVTGPASVGTYTNMKTYANVGHGMHFVGTAPNPLSGVRLFGGFIGEDCSSELYFDTYSATTMFVQNMFIEISGTSACGPGFAVAATHQGNGAQVTANNTVIAFIGNTFIGNSYSGLSSAAGKTQVTGNNFRLNGAAALPGELAGIAITGGSATIVGNYSAGQTFGISLAGDGHVVVGNDLTGNSTAPLVAAANLISSNVCNNIPTQSQTCVLLTQGIGNTAATINQYVDINYTNAAFTASRTWTLPAANTVAPGKRIQVQDWQGTVTATNTLVISRAGSDTINGGTSLTLRNAYDGVTLVSDGTSKWTADIVGVSHGGTGDTGTAWTTYTPTVSCGSGTLTSATATGRYKTLGKTVFFEASLAITTNGTCATSLVFGLPPSVTAASNSPLVGEDYTAGKTLTAGANSGATVVNVLLYDGTYPGGSGKTIAIGGVLEQQ